MFPHGYIARPPSMDEVQAVTDLINLRSTHDVGGGDESVDRMRMFWEEEARDLTRDNIVVVAPDGSLAAYADYDEWEPYDLLQFSIAVHPNHMDVGLEAALLDWAEARAADGLAKAAPEVRVRLETMVWASSDCEAERLRQRGFRFQREWNRMRIDMESAPPEPTIPEGITIRTLDLGRDGEVDLVHEAWEDAQSDEWGFASLTSQEWNYYLVEREANFDPSLWFLAIDDASGEIVGYVLGRWERPGEPEMGQVRYLGVRRPWRRRGIAQAMLLRAFGEFWRRGKPAVGLSVDSVSPTGADRLYDRVGMRAVRCSHVYDKVLREPAEPAPSRE